MVTCDSFELLWYDIVLHTKYFSLIFIKLHLLLMNGRWCYSMHVKVKEQHVEVISPAV